MIENRINLSNSDIVMLDVDAIVNAANAALSGGGGVDGAIHRAAGPNLLKACRGLGRCEPGKAVVTPGFNLKATWVIHAVGPVWYGGDQDEELLLRSTYRSALELVQQKECNSVAFPAISCGAYRYPHEPAASIATEEILDWLGKNKHPRSVTISCFDQQTLKAYRSVLDA